MMDMENLTGEQVRDFVLVAAAVITFLVLLGSLIKVIKDWKKPHDDLEAWRRDVDEKLDRDNKRLNNVEEGIRVICRSNLAMMSHELNGNSNDKLIASQQELMDYLIER